ncbi:MAG: YidC/Oxa1 family membrane protein insertase [Actinomycetota bacterium]|nr:YidC/Oxa1 family membrane protein insertase [Actinomycetota bacterium]
MFTLANIFQPLIDVFEAVIKFFHNSIGVPWGWSIVLLTVVVRAVLVPLTVKQYHSMQKLQALSPQLKAIQTKYKEDKQRQQQEMMKFYKENQVNPFASCLPLVAQLPVFVSLFYLLKSSLRQDICPQIQHQYKLHYFLAHGTHTTNTVQCGPRGGASFLFISDLTNRAVGATLIVLIVLYVGTQLASTLMMSTPTMERNQRLLMMFLPLFFVVFIIQFPAGVIVYWITTNSWTILQQYIIRKRIGPPPTPVVDAGAGGGGGGPARGGGGGSGPGGGGSSDGGNGLGAGGLAGLLGRARAAQSPGKPKQPAGVSAGGEGRRAAPPPPPRKKKKRSGRRR